MKKETDDLASVGTLLFLMFTGLAMMISPWFMVIALYGLIMMIASLQKEVN